MREFSQVAFSLAGRLFIDTAHARHESGDVMTPVEKNWLPESGIQTLGGFLLSGEDEKPLYERTTLYKSVGMAIFDLMAALSIYRRAQVMGLGRPLAL